MLERKAGGENGSIGAQAVMTGDDGKTLQKEVRPGVATGRPAALDGRLSQAGERGSAVQHCASSWTQPLGCSADQDALTTGLLCGAFCQVTLSPYLLPTCFYFCPLKSLSSCFVAAFDRPSGQGRYHHQKTEGRAKGRIDACNSRGHFSLSTRRINLNRVLDV